MAKEMLSQQSSSDSYQWAARVLLPSNEERATQWLFSRINREVDYNLSPSARNSVFIVVMFSLGLRLSVITSALRSHWLPPGIFLYIQGRSRSPNWSSVPD